ncbi:MAG TPA: flagellar FlbD family protein [Stenomitos sp.]
MIKLTRLNGNEFVVNCDLIENVEAAPDTIVSLTTNQRYVVRESVDEVIERVAEFKRRSHPDARLFLKVPAAQKDAPSDERLDAEV